jgi:drug/metabolite transporter (DMT)-like permease
LSLLGEPVGSTILAYFLFQEGMTLLKFCGGFLIMAGIYLAAKQEVSDQFSCSSARNEA